jgi:hypothetical protein
LQHLFADYDKLVKPDETVTVDYGLAIIGLNYNAHLEVSNL